jgi:hypothetical protein
MNIYFKIFGLLSPNTYKNTSIHMYAHTIHVHSVCKHFASYREYTPYMYTLYVSTSLHTENTHNNKHSTHYSIDRPDSWSNDAMGGDLALDLVFVAAAASTQETLATLLAAGAASESATSATTRK